MYSNSLTSSEHIKKIPFFFVYSINSINCLDWGDSKRHPSLSMTTILVLQNVLRFHMLTCLKKHFTKNLTMKVTWTSTLVSVLSKSPDQQKVPIHIDLLWNEQHLVRQYNLCLVKSHWNIFMDHSVNLLYPFSNSYYTYT